MMYEWAFILFFFTSITAILAFSGATGGIVFTARILFFILLILTVLVLFSSFFNRKKSNPRRLQIDIK